MTYYNRRRFLKTTAALGFAGSTGLLSALTAQSANAMDVSGYKALVCVFFKGGIDGYDTVLPYDQDSYNALKNIRPDLMALHDSDNPESSRYRENLLSIGSTTGDTSRTFALPVDMTELKALYDAGDMAVVGNVGPLIEPSTRSSFENFGSRLPKNLFSHNDQQSTWMSMAIEGRNDGWGAKFAKVAADADPTMNRAFSAITTSSSDIFLRGRDVSQFKTKAGGTAEASIISQRWKLRSAKNSETARNILRRHFGSENHISASVLQSDLATANQRGQETLAQYMTAAENTSPITTEFPNTGLGRQLQAVAEAISLRGALNVSRQVFFTEIGGFDSHDNQAISLPNKQREISQAIAAFQQAMSELGTLNDVTTFTASDFGRTMVSNGDGTDHGWGNHHFVVGGAVRGQRILGDIPGYDLGLQNYTETRGRLIPTTSVDEYAATLGRWFGLNDTDLATVLPYWSNFDRNYLDLF
jgi:uncharacterized protein (DUF1501 family)